MAVLTDEVPREALSQDDDTIELLVTFSDENKRQVSEAAEITWNEILKVIGPSLFGFIVRKQSGYGQRAIYPFQEDIEDFLRRKFIKRVQNRRLKVDPSQIDGCIIQFKELGYIKFSEKVEDDGGIFRGITLTELGERKLTLLNAKIRKPPDLSSD